MNKIGLFFGIIFLCLMIGTAIGLIGYVFYAPLIFLATIIFYSGMILALIFFIIIALLMIIESK